MTTSGHAPYGAAELTPAGATMPILLVEDDRRDIELALIALERCDLAADVAVARDGAQALEYLRREGAFATRGPGEPAVVLLDLKLPKVDGLEVLRAMRADAALRLLPAVMLTSSREDIDVTRAYAFGANAYVVKPGNMASYVDAMGQLGVFWARTNTPPPWGSVQDL